MNTKVLHRVELGLLLQLMEANLGEGTVPHVLLGRLALAVHAKDIDEVETLLLLLRHGASNDEAVRLEVHRLLRDAPGLAELLCSAAQAQTVSVSLSSPLELAPADGTSSDHNPPSGGAGHRAVTPTTRRNTDNQFLSEMLTSQVMTWCAQHPAEWELAAASATKALQRSRERQQEKARDRSVASEVRREKALKQKEKAAEQEAEVTKLFTKMKMDAQTICKDSTSSLAPSLSSSFTRAASPLS
ncbi:hypothetical protein STCU_12294 [Strigomonas culicis]|nr:hypothetical protein STCU_12294 [Strigomonas culicis]|eukprot:EPY15166.1 hypothetical protein STCU_12294 [Strigomonas culicis]